MFLNGALETPDGRLCFRMCHLSRFIPIFTLDTPVLIMAIMMTMPMKGGEGE